MRGVLVFLLALFALASTQPPPPSALGLVSGVVVDAAGNAVPGATVELRRDARVERTTTTDAAGVFRFEGVVHGSYEVRVSLAGFVPASRRLAVGSRAVAQQHIALTAAPVAEPVAAPASPRADIPFRKAGAYAQNGIISGAAGIVGMPGWPAAFDTESYDRIDDNAFHKPSDDPLSTFSIDVDTASYTNVRRFLNEGACRQPMLSASRS